MKFCMDIELFFAHSLTPISWKKTLTLLISNYPKLKKKTSSTTKQQHPASNKEKQNTENNIHQTRKKKSFYNQNTFPNSEKNHIPHTQSTHSGWVKKQRNALKPRVSPAICVRPRTTWGSVSVWHLPVISVSGCGEVEKKNKNPKNFGEWCYINCLGKL